MLQNKLDISNDFTIMFNFFMNTFLHPNIAPISTYSICFMIANWPQMVFFLKNFAYQIYRKQFPPKKHRQIVKKLLIFDFCNIENLDCL